MASKLHVSVGEEGSERHIHKGQQGGLGALVLVRDLTLDAVPEHTQEGRLEHACFKRAKRGEGSPQTHRIEVSWSCEHTRALSTEIVFGVEMRVQFMQSTAKCARPASVA
jgi:hypothetical protein